MQLFPIRQVHHGGLRLDVANVLSADQLALGVGVKERRNDSLASRSPVGGDGTITDELQGLGFCLSSLPLALRDDQLTLLRLRLDVGNLQLRT